MSVGYQKPMFGGLSGVKVGFSEFKNIGAGLKAMVAQTVVDKKAPTTALGDVLLKNETKVISLGFKHTMKNLETGLFLNSYANNFHLNDNINGESHKWHAVELGTSYSF